MTCCYHRRGWDTMFDHYWSQNLKLLQNARLYISIYLVSNNLKSLIQISLTLSNSSCKESVPFQELNCEVINCWVSV